MKRNALTIKVLSRVFPALLGVLAALPGVSAHADSFGYASPRRQIKACILYSTFYNTTTQTTTYNLDNFAPFTFYVLDKRTDLKPMGWEFMNPMAPTTITPDQYTRMSLRANGGDASLTAPSVVQVGKPLTKNILSYWEVNLTTVKASDLKQFDIILLPLSTNRSPSLAEGAKLKQYVDGGGTLWIENEGGMPVDTTLVNMPVDVEFENAGGGGAGQTIATLQHTLVTYPYAFTTNDMSILGANSSARFHKVPTFGSPNFLSLLTPIITSGAAGSYISAGDYGGGHILVSSAGVARGINSFVGGTSPNGYGLNTGAVSGESFQGARPVDLKFAYNLVTWASTAQTPGGSARRLASTNETISSELGKKWTTVPVPAAGPGSNNPGAGATLYKGVIYYVDGANFLHAFDANPATDLDGDGVADDGIQDAPDSSFDEIWRTHLPNNNRFSTPTVYSTSGSGGAVDIVTVTDDSGVTYAYNALPRNGSNLLLGLTTATALWSVTGGGTLATPKLGTSVDTRATYAPVSSPALSEGVLFSVVQTSNTPPWRIAASNAQTGTSVFGTGNVDAVPTTGGLPDILGPITVGYVQDQETGALDKVVYATVDALNNTTNGNVAAFWFSTRNEPLDATDPADASNRHHTFRPKGLRGLVPWFTGSGMAGTLPVLHMVQLDNGAQTDLRMGTDFTVSYTPNGNGTTGGMTITLTGTGIDSSLFVLSADYTVDWPGAVVGTSGTPAATDLTRWITRKGFIPPTITGATAATLVRGAPALTPEGNLIFTTTEGGLFPEKIYSFNDQSPANQNATRAGGNARTSEVTWMFSPTDTGVAVVGTDPIPQRLINGDLYAGAGNTAIKNFQAFGSPVVSNGTAYVLGTANIGANSVTVLLALRANPNNTFSLGQTVAITAGAALPVITVKQQDTSPTPASPDGLITLVPDDPVTGALHNYSVDYNSSSITVHNFRTNNNISANAALPFYVTVDNNPQFRVGDTVNGQVRGPLDNLLWYMVIPRDLSGIDSSMAGLNVVPQSSPSLMGNTLFFGTNTGRVISVDLSGAASGGQLHLYAKDSTNPPTDPRVHVMPTLVDPSTGFPLAQSIYEAPLGSNGVVAVGTALGLTALDNRTTLVADGTRLLEIDYGVNAVWDLSSSLSLKVAGGQLAFFQGSAGNGTGQVTQQKTGFSKASLAHRIDKNNVLVVDNGNNRVVQVDNSGNVIQEISSVNNGMGFLGSGEPITLNHPTDASAFIETGTNKVFPRRNADGTVTPFSFTGAYYAIHYIIADGGNYRALEVVDLFNPNGTPYTFTDASGNLVTMLHQVIFVTRSLAEQNAHLRFRSIQQFADGGSNVYWLAAVDNLRQANPDPNTTSVGLAGNNADGSGGSLMLINRFDQGGAKAGDTAVLIDSIMIPSNPNNPGNAAAGYRRQAVSNPTSLKAFWSNIPQANTLHYLMTDANGAYQLVPRVINLKSELAVEWMVSNDDYRNMTGRPLRATSIQKLSQADFYQPPMQSGQFFPHYLITNSYSGSDSITNLFASNNVTQKGEIHGEVIEIRSLDYFLNNGAYPPAAALYAVNANVLTKNSGSAIVWMAPKETIPLLATPGPIKRSIGSSNKANSTYVFEQPLTSERQ